MNMQDISKLMGTVLEGLEERLKIWNLLSDTQKEAELQGWLDPRQPDPVRICEFLWRVVTPMVDWSCLKEMCASPEWEMYMESVYSSMPLDDTCRYKRIMEEAEKGGDGSTHEEVIYDMRAFLDSQCLWDPEWDALEDGRRDKLLAPCYHRLIAELDEVEEHHRQAGTLTDTIG